MRVWLSLVCVSTLWSCADEDDPNATPGGGGRDAGGLLADASPTPGDASTQEDAGDIDAASDEGPVDAAPPDAGPPPAPRWWHGDVFYEIFVRSFQDSDGDGVGDIQGVIDRLDYLNDGDPSTTSDLGVEGIWLMPINPSPSYHGYDVTDYKAINPQYGTLEDLDRLLDEAHQRGIRVVMDFVVNHSSAQHPWFQEARRGPDAERRDWYVWRQSDPGWRPPQGLGPTLWHPAGGGWLYYGVFWSGMPDLNHREPAVYDAMLDAARFWLDRGVDGFRFDAVRYLVESEGGELADQPETHAWFKRLRADLESSHPEPMLLAEAWSANDKVAAYYGDGDELHLAFNFDVSQAIQQAARSGDAAQLRFALDASARQFPDRMFEAPFITNHDMNRLIRDNRVGVPEFKAAVALLMALPGTPFLYYGEEIGMEGGPLEADEDKRTPMRWTPEGPSYGFTSGQTWRSRAEAEGVDVETQRADPDSLWSHTRDLIALRKGSTVWSLGAAERLQATGGPGVVALLRTHEGRRGLCVVDFGEAEEVITITLDAPTLTPEVIAGSGGATLTATEGGLQIEGLGPLGWLFIEL